MSCGSYMARGVHPLVPVVSRRRISSEDRYDGVVVGVLVVSTSPGLRHGSPLTDSAEEVVKESATEATDRPNLVQPMQYRLDILPVQHLVDRICGGRNLLCALRAAGANPNAEVKDGGETSLEGCYLM